MTFFENASGLAESREVEVRSWSAKLCQGWEGCRMAS
jgi:hypothetical protein